MNKHESGLDVIDELAVAEASAWLLRLQDSDCPSDKAAFRDWLTADPAHPRAFERVNSTWEWIPGAVEHTRRTETSARRRSRARRGPWLAAAACLALLLIAAGAVRMLVPAGSSVYQTAAGQQKSIVLPDNTRVTLNTDTRLVVEYRRNERLARLEHGEALFHVKENAKRPFVLQTGDQEVIDLGTVFNVNHYAQDVAVTLLEGKVWVGARTSTSAAGAHPTILEPGERVTVGRDGVHVVDRPNVQDVTAWQHGRVYFDDTTLQQAIAELNRYGGAQIRVADPALDSLRISGVFSTHDPVQFANAVANLHGLRARRTGGAIVLRR